MKSQEITANTLHTAVDKWQGFSIREDAGTPAQAAVTFRKVNGSGAIVGVLELAADESATLIHKKKINVEGGLYVAVDAGTIEGTLYYD